MVGSLAWMHTRHDRVQGLNGEKTGPNVRKARFALCEIELDLLQIGIWVIGGRHRHIKQNSSGHCVPNIHNALKLTVTELMR